MSSSFQQTCNSVSINEDTLQANCQTKNGSWKDTSLQLKGVANIDGNLQVVDPYESASFQKSCRDISINGDVLSATCQRRDGSWMQTQITLNNIANIDGNLTYE